jgi:hypothetical protein
MELVDQIGKQKMPTILKDPFSKNTITAVSVSYRFLGISKEWYASGYVEFKNGNTGGKQEFRGNTFDDVVFQIKGFINELKGGK